MTLPTLFVLMAVMGLGIGAILGSFLGALVMRWPQGRSVLNGRSACDSCGRTLRIWELVPLLSACISLGRCRACNARIDNVHMLMEAGCGFIGAAAMIMTTQAVVAENNIGLSVMNLMLLALPVAMGWMIFGWILLSLAVLDARHYWLPDALTLSLLFLGLTIGPWVMGTSLTDALIGAGVGYGSLLAVALGYKMLRNRDGLGLGDAKLLGALGAWLGWQALPFILLLASVAALMWVVVRKIMGADIDAMTRIAFGTFLCAAALPAYYVTQHFLMRG